MLKRLVTGALSAALVLSLTLVPASAHGGHGRGHGRNQANRSQQVSCTVCQTTHARGACTINQSCGHGTGACYRA